jgi:PAS domain S-box-containing protein
MGTLSPFDEIALKAKVAELSRRLAEAEAALVSAATGAPQPLEPAGPRELLQEATETLAIERNLLREVIDMIPDHVFVRDRASRHVFNNRATLEQLGAMTLEETIGKTDFDYFPPEMARKFRASNEEAMSTGRTLASIEEMIPGPGGDEVWWSTTKVPLRDGDGAVVGLVGIGRNITERRKVSQKIAEQAAMLDHAHDAIILLTLDDRVVYMNGAAEQMLGWSAKDAIGMTGPELYPAGDRAMLALASNETRQNGSWHGELRLHHKSGREIHVDIHRSLIRDERGAPKAQLSISADITERKRTEALALRNQRLESLGTLAGGIAHDLNNVLAPILMSITLLKMKVSDEGGQRLLVLLEKNAERGAQLVRHVLAFGRGAEGQRIEVQTLDVAREVGQIIKDTFPKNVRFEFVSTGQPWTVVGDPNLIHQVLLNLCVNARDAMPKGGKITLTIENENIDETFASMNEGAHPGPHVAITISDTGTGISPDLRERIFEPFFTTKDVGKGTGLGLSTSLGIVQNHGGFIQLESIVGEGSTFRVHLPANPASEAARPSAKNPEGLAMGHNELILVVDDEEPILEVAKSTLEKFGYRVVVATNGAEAVSIYALKRDSIAAVVTDMAMPIMDGPAMVVALRAINPGIKIIGSSGMKGPSVLAASRAAGVCEFVPKPCSAETLLGAIARALEEPPDAPKDDARSGGPKNPKAGKRTKARKPRA